MAVKLPGAGMQHVPAVLGTERKHPGVSKLKWPNASHLVDFRERQRQVQDHGWFDEIRRSKGASATATYLSAPP